MRYACDLCTKSYNKPSRLEEHRRTHSGHRPFKCETCNKTYFRESHLHAHARSHQPVSARPLECGLDQCTRRFWTTQHLRVHQKLHAAEKAFQCTESGCADAFAKHHQLRAHISTVHHPPGTQSFLCDHDACTKSFSTNQKLRAHRKVHDDKRYTCVHQACLPTPAATPTYYPTWTALQRHARTAHPPTCTRPTCNGKIFTTQRALRAHQKLHEQRDAEVALDASMFSDGDAADGDARPCKRRRGSQLGRDWRCTEVGCEKDFKSKQALTTHIAIAHEGRRDFVCPHAQCKRAFGYKKLLARHLVKMHGPPESEDEDTETDSVDEQNDDDDNTGDEGESSMPLRQTAVDIDTITGAAYSTRAAALVQSAHALRCPWPAVDVFVGTTDLEMAKSICEYVFNRAYDLQRHLSSAHGLQLERGAVYEWVNKKKETSGAKN